jgi:hypothetical protein
MITGRKIRGLFQLSYALGILLASAASGEVHVR